MAEQRVHHVTRPLLNSVRLTCRGIDVRRRYRCVCEAAVQLIRGDVDSALRDQFIRLDGAADERHDLVFPVDLCKRIGRTVERDHIGIERMMLKEGSVIDLVVLVDSQRNLSQVRLAIHLASGFARLLNGGEEQRDRCGAMIAMTTSNSTSVNPLRRFGMIRTIKDRFPFHTQVTTGEEFIERAVSRHRRNRF